MALSPEDRLELEQLYSTYCYFLDVNDPDGFASTWVPDGVFKRPIAAKRIGQAEERHGHDELKAMVMQWSSDQPLSTERPRHQHWINNIWFESVDENSVTGHASVMILETAGESGTVITMGFYTDDVVKTSEGWRFKTRTATLWF